MKSVFLLLFSGMLLSFSGCEKCELEEEVTLHIDFDGFSSRFENLPTNTWLDNYDTSMARQSVRVSFDFLGNEVMVHPADSLSADYVLTIDKVVVKEVHREQTETQVCTDDDEQGWLCNILNPPDPPDTYHFILDGIYIQVTAHIFSKKTGKTYFYDMAGETSETATTAPPAGADTTGNPCFEWRKEPAPLLENTYTGHVNHAIHNASHAIFMKFKCEAAKERGK